LIKEGKGVAVNVLKNLGLNLENVRMEVEKQVGVQSDQKITGRIPFTPRMKRVFETAKKEAKLLNHTYVRTEHILLGLLHESEGVAARVFKNFYVEIEQTRKEILNELNPNFPPGNDTYEI
jgi:ATP-dependent Clp protease ATP-binding subunit ClpC